MSSSADDSANSGVGWYIAIEQSVDEAFAEVARSDARTCLLVGLGVLVLVVVLSILGRAGPGAGTGESAYAHAKKPWARILRCHHRTRHGQILEVSAVAKLTQRNGRRPDKSSAKRPGRASALTTFAGVAAGLAHDIRLPIEAVLSACEHVIADPDDDGRTQPLAQGDRARFAPAPALHGRFETPGPRWRPRAGVRAPSMSTSIARKISATRCQPDPDVEWGRYHLPR